jgi:hypothetical protein
MPPQMRAAAWNDVWRVKHTRLSERGNVSQQQRTFAPVIRHGKSANTKVTVHENRVRLRENNGGSEKQQRARKMYYPYYYTR